MAATKLHYLHALFNNFLEPNDIIDKFAETGAFSDVGMVIRSVEGNDTSFRQQRVQIFLQWFDKYEPQNGNKFQELEDVLSSSDSCYKWLVPLLKDHEVLDDRTVKRLERLQKPEKAKAILQIIFPALTDINVEDVMEHMRGALLNGRDMDEILQVVKRQSRHHALYVFLHKLIYKPPDWIDAFIEAIKELKYNATTPMLRGDSKALTLADALRGYFGFWDEEEAAGEISMEIDEAPQQMLGQAPSLVETTANMRQLKMTGDLPKDMEIPDCQTSTMSCKTSEEKSITPMEQNLDVLESKLYNYQKELCKPALTSNSPNVVICAPTGSGKTMVAAHIINQHLKGNKSGKVAFFTPNGGLAEQQCKKMENYMPERAAAKEIVMLRGNMESDISKDFSRKIYSSSLIIMTPQILLNCLKNKAVPSLFDFTMMIFDECHHARASHPYSEILKKYLEGKEEQEIQRRRQKDIDKEKKTIQIIGLTATLGIGSAENHDQATENIFKLLGILDAWGGIVIVRDPENVNELMEKCPTAGEDQKYINHGDEDPFKDVIKSAVGSVVSLLRGMKAFDELKIQSREVHCGTLKKDFEGWCQKLRVAAEGHIDGEIRENEETKHSTLGRDTKSCAETLLRLKRAHDLCHNCHPSDAISEIEQFVASRYKEHQEKNTDLENIVQKLLNDAIVELKSREEDAENKMLRIIEERIRQKKEEDPDFRCMVMVSRRLYATYLQQWIKNSELLKGLGAQIYIGIGTKSTSEMPGMTHKKQADAIEGFNKGLFRVLVCTPDAAGEGIDIALCNLVITIDCVRDEVRRIQLRGRARKENSEVLYISFHNDGTAKDTLTIEKQFLMERATRQIEKMSKCETDKYRRKLNEGRAQATGQMRTAEEKKRNAPSPQTGRRDSVLCRSCSTYVCCTTELIRMNGNHHTVNDNRFRNKYTRANHDSRGGLCGSTNMRHVYRIQCAECKCQWGNEVVWKRYLVPILGIRGFKIKDSYRGKVYLPSKWKNTKLHIPERSKDDGLCRMLFERCDEEVGMEGDSAA